MKELLKKYFPTDISRQQSSDTGMVIAFIILVIGWWMAENSLVDINYVIAAIIVLLIDMTVPKFFYPLAVFWFGLANVLGAIMSKVIMTIAFVFLVTPVGLFRRLMGKDSLRLKQFKKGTETVMHIRNHTYTPKDIEKPY